MFFRYLATGDSYKTIYLNYRLGKSTVATIIPEVCDTIWQKLQPQYMPIPNEDAWTKIADGFQERWQFPNCIGALESMWSSRCHQTLDPPFIITKVVSLLFDGPG